jgi:hypothetical protein
MATKIHPPLAKRHLHLENLESRLNLSGFGFSPLVPQTVTRAVPSHIVRGTFTTVKATSPSLTAASTTSLLPVFGDTSVPSSGAATIPVTSYSVMTGAQIENVTGTPDVGYMSTAGADIEYKVTAAAAGSYQLTFSVAAMNSSTFDLAVNGTTQAQYAFGATGAWQTYTTTSQTVTLAAGSNVIKISPTWASQFNINGITLSPVSAGSTTPTTTVGASATVAVGSYSAISNSQLEAPSGTPDIGYVSTSGAYVEYTLNVQTAGTYSVAVGTAAVSQASMSLSVNGTASATYSLASTGNWQNYAESAQSVYLPAGKVTLRFSSLNGTQYNLGAIFISQGAAVTTPVVTGTAVGSSTVSVPVGSYTAISNSQLESQGGTPDIGYVSTSGAYVQYTLNVATAGNYTLNVATASTNAASFSVAVNGTGEATYNVNSTGSWSAFATTGGSVYLPAGTVTLRFSSLNGTQYNLGGITLSPAGTAPTNTPSGNGFDATVSTVWMTSFNQLNVTAGSKNDTVLVTQSGSTVTVNVNGVSNSYSGTFGDIVVKAGSGNDSITIDSSVTTDTLLYGGSGTDTLKNLTQGNATIVSIGDGFATIQGNGKNTAYWVDSGDSVSASSTETSAGDVHRVSGFWGGISTSLAGQNLADPSGTGSVTRISNASLWGTGPTMSDVNQGQSSDCYFLGAIQTMANSAPGALRQLAVDLGDGTYAVQFKRGGTTTYVRVDGDLPAGGPYANGLEYAHPGASGDLWVPIMEKAYAEYRTGSWSYASLDEGNFGTVYSDFGVAYNTLNSSSPSALYGSIVSALNNGKGVTIGTTLSISGGTPLIYDHAYTVTAAWTDSSGTEYVQVRNPWGFDGAGNDGNSGDALVTLTVGQLSQNYLYGTALA